MRRCGISDAATVFETTCDALQAERKQPVLYRFFSRWAHIVNRHPWSIVIVAFAIAATGGTLASHIAIKSDFASLLPDSAQSVKDLRAISDRMGGMGTLILEIDGQDLGAMERFAEALVAKLKTYPKDEIKFIDYRIDRQKAFFDKNKFLYVSEEELTDMRDQLKERVRREKLKANPLYVDFGDDDEDAPEEIDFAKRKEEYEAKGRKFDKFIDGYLTSEDGKTLLIVIKTPGTATGVTFAGYIVDKIHNDVNALQPAQFHPSLKVYYTGGLQTLREEYYALRDDILVVSNLCVLLVFLAVALYYRSIRITLILCTGLLAGVLTTFGLVYLHIGYLTAATAFLAAIVAGNGINFGIYFLARYMEERRKNEPVPDTLTHAMVGTVKSVSTAAFAAGASYASLMFTDFRGFNQFGFIGGVGMLICLLFALTLNPALVVIMERYLPMPREDAGTPQRGRIFSNAAAWLVERYSRPILVVGTVVLLASAVVLALFLRDPFEYRYKTLRNQYARTEGSGARSTKAESILGERSSPHVILADNLKQVPAIKEVIEQYFVNTPDPDKRVIKEVRTIYDALPGDAATQDRKLAILKDIRDIIDKNNFDFLSDEDRKLLDELTPPADLRRLTMDDLPVEILRQYIEDNGTKGTPVYVYMADGMSVWDGHDLEKFADAVREIKLSNGHTIRSSGHAVIFTDMTNYVSREGPWATLGAFIFVTLVIIVAFRRFRHIWLLAASMGAGVLLMMGIAVVAGQKINFLNYIAIPIQFGIGVDYSVNIYTRFLEEGPGSIGRVLRSTGGAVMITSLTTIIGYGALWFSINGAINSFGWLANIGEVACLAVAVLLLPAYLAVRRNGLEKRA